MCSKMGMWAEQKIGFGPDIHCLKSQSYIFNKFCCAPELC